MSSLAATQADGYYYPTEWRPEHGSLNQFHASRLLGEQAKRVPREGALIVRFEMPFDVWCTHCREHIGRGVRFNARKQRVGQYFSSSVWEFYVRCANCKGELVIRTDPKTRSYELVRGVRKKADAEDAVDELQTERLNDPGLALKLQSDPFLKLEHAHEDQRRAKKRSRGLEALVQLQDAEFKDDVASNSALRAKFRSTKKRLASRKQEAKRLGIGIPLVDVHSDDVVASRRVVFKGISQQHRRPSHRQSGAGKLRCQTPAPAASVDSFQHFGDPTGSQLQRLKGIKQAAKKRRATLRK